MKQLTVFCSRDLEEQVVSVLEKAGVDGYLRIGDATGQKFLPKGEVPRSVRWEAAVIVIPGAQAPVIDGIVAELRRIAQDCEIEPCIRLLVVTACEVY